MTSKADSARRLAVGLVVLAALLTGAAPRHAATAADKAGTVRLNLIWTNDVHGHIDPEPARFMNPQFPPPLGGGASLATYVKDVRAEAAKADEPVLLVDVGDFFQGTPVGNKTHGDAMIAFFNTMGYDAMVPGNHDFDLGRDNLERLRKNTDIPWLCANLRDEKTGKIVDWCRPTMMVEEQGVKIGLIGIITPGTKVMSFPDNIKGLIFDPMAPVVEKYRDELKAQGADMIGLLIHEGLPYDPKQGWEKIAANDADRENTQQEGDQTAYGHVTGGAMNLMELVHAVSGIAFAVGGHTHRGYEEPWIDPVTQTMCFESFGNGSSVGHVILDIDRGTKQLVGWEPAHDRGTLVTLFEDELWPDQEMRDTLNPYIERTNAEMGQVVGHAAVNITRGDPGSSLMGNLVTDAMRAYFDADFSFQNSGGLRADIPAGDITARDVFGVLPFGNQLDVVRMKGAMIRRVIERKVVGEGGGLCVSGVRVRFNRSLPDWHRVCELEVGGEPLDPNRTYKVVVTSFLMEGNSGLDFLTSVPAKDIELTQITTAEALEHYLKLHDPVRPHIDDRWVEDPDCGQASYLSLSSGD